MSVTTSDIAPYVRRAPMEAMPPPITMTGACGAFVRERFAYFVYGSYPVAERWRVDVFFAMLAIGVAWLLWLNAPRRDLGAIYFFVVLPIVSFVLLSGWRLIRLPVVETIYWGGML